MASIPGAPGVFNSVDQSPSGQSPSHSSKPDQSNNPALSDTVALESVPLLPQVEQLKATNVSEFQRTLTNAVRELRVAANDTTDPLQASYFLGLANRFQQLQEETTNYSAPQGTIPPAAGA